MANKFCPVVHFNLKWPRFRGRTQIPTNYLSTLSGPAFSVDRQAWGGLRGPDAKNQGKRQPIGMKLGMSHNRRKSIPDAKFESGSSSSFGDMMSQNFPWKKGMSHQIRLFTPGKWI